MSRIGDSLITIPAGVQVTLEGQKVSVRGAKGELFVEVRPEIKVEVVESTIKVSRKKEDRLSRSLHGLTRSLINNAVLGVSVGWTKTLEMVGVGYRAQGSGNQVSLSVGFSHPVVFKSPEGVNLVVSENTKLAVSGIDKHLVGQIAANIRSIKPPEVYKGKGIRYTGEQVRRKAGKAGKAK